MPVENEPQQEQTAEPQAAAAPPPKKGWLGRNWKWCLPSGCLVVIVLFFGCCGGGAFLVMGKLKDNDVYRQALTRVKSDPQVVAAIGTPIKASWAVSGNISVQAGGTGTIALAFTVSGPKGSASVETAGTKSGGVWTITSLKVTLSDGTTLDLTQAGDTAAPAPAPAPAGA